MKNVAFFFLEDHCVYPLIGDSSLQNRRHADCSTANVLQSYHYLPVSLTSYSNMQFSTLLFFLSIFYFVVGSMHSIMQCFAPSFYYL